MPLILKSVRINNNGDPKQGSLNCRKNDFVPILPIHSVTDGLEPMVDIFVPRVLQRNFEIIIEVFNSEVIDINTSIDATEVSTQHIFGNMNFLGANFATGATTKVTAQINHGNMLIFVNSLRKFLIELRWSYTILGLTTDIINTKHTLYLLPYNPLNTNLWCVRPELYNRNGMYYVWTDLLDICCDACKSYNDKTGNYPVTNEEHIRAFTIYHNNCGIFSYDTLRGASNYAVKSGIDNTFKLKKFIQHYNSGMVFILNCSDCATIVAIEGLVCGIQMYTAQMRNTNIRDNGFLCNPVISIGYADWAIPFGNGFSYHEVAVGVNACDQNTGIFDACLHIDNQATPSSVGPAGKNAILPLGIPFAETESVNVNVLEPYNNQYYRERLVRNGGNCFINVNSIKLQNITMDLTMILDGYKSDEQNVYLHTKKYYGLEKNTLPTGELYQHWQTTPDNFSLISNGIWTLDEDYNENKVYKLEYNNKNYEVSLWFPKNEQDAYIYLLSRLSGISNPNVERGSIGDISFKINDYWKLFVKKNVLIEIFCENGDVEEISTMLSDSL